MTITLEKATKEDAETLHALQIKCFLPLLDKYKDHGTNPACEPIDKTLTRITDPLKGFYKILKDNILVGGIVVKHTNPVELLSQKIISNDIKIFKENTSPGKSLYFLDPDGHKLEIHVDDWKTRLQVKKKDLGTWKNVEWFI